MTASTLPRSFLLALVVLLAACVQSEVVEGSPAMPNPPDSDSGPAGAGSGTAQTEDIPPSLDVDTFLEAAAVEGAVVVDVRTPREWAGGVIAGSKLIDFRAEGFIEAIRALTVKGPLLLTCHSGGRSARAREILKGEGFAHVQDLSGGIKAWAAAGKPTVSPPAE